MHDDTIATSRRRALFAAAAGAALLAIAGLRGLPVPADQVQKP